MLVIFVRTIILYLVLLVVMRLMGKRQIGEMQPFEFIITLLIAELACIPMTDVSIPLSYGIASVVAVFILHQIMSLLENFGEKVKFLLSGKPSLVITPKGVDVAELKRNSMGIGDLAEALRSLGYFSFEEVDYAIFESNGKLSALKSDKRASGGLPLLIIDNGKVQKNNLTKLQVDFSELKRLLKDKINNEKNVEILTLNENGKVYLQLKNKPYEVLNIKE